tara:strand:+ start:501 stop:917 length:417 start_codon:yes stop_codon:yes gene_type:complete
MSRIVFLLTVLALSASCSTAASAAQGRFLRSEGSKLFVFVHGFNTSSADTWTNKNNGTNVFWPDLLVRDKVFQDFAIYIYDYASSLGEGSPTIQGIAADLATDLEANAQLESYQHVYFLAHSMGGLVTLTCSPFCPRL